MVVGFEELRVLKAAEAVTDGIWRQVVCWEAFARDTVGKQMARAGDSIGANIAEAYGRFHYSEKLQFLYYARGSLFETKCWLNRASERELIPSSQVEDYAGRLTDLARQLNSFANDLKAQRQGGRAQTKTAREARSAYTADPPPLLFTDEDLNWLATTPISNL